MLTKFGYLCREYRLQRRLYLADQAEGVGVSVPTVSAIERGNRTATVEYAQKVAKWLGLSPKQASELVSSLAQVDNIVKFRPRSPEAASFAFNLANRLNSLTPQDIERMKKILDEGVRIYE